MRGFGPSNVFHYFSTMHPKPNELFSGSELEKVTDILESCHNAVAACLVGIVLRTTE